MSACVGVSVSASVSACVRVYCGWVCARACMRVCVCAYVQVSVCCYVQMRKLTFLWFRTQHTHTNRDTTIHRSSGKRHTGTCIRGMVVSSRGWSSSHLEYVNTRKRNVSHNEKRETIINSLGVCCDSKMQLSVGLGG